MIKVFLLIVISVSAALVLAYGFHSPQGESKRADQISSPTITPTQSPKAQKSLSIFVPYWAKGKNSINVTGYDRAIYFGVGVRNQEVDTSDIGYTIMSDFVSEISLSKKVLAIRMLDTDKNTALLQNEKSWSFLNKNIATTAKDNRFTGVLLDLEMSAAPFQNIVDSITAYTTSFCTEMHAANLTCSVAIYGDTFYRQRPYDVKAIAAQSDEIMIMAYDFHKSRGEPGPNFPLLGKEKYGYDYVQMVRDFSVVPKDKLTVIFGMYGYDWGVDENKKPIRPAKAMGDIDIQKQFIDTCETKNCTILPDQVSGETEIDYIDKNLLYHIVWFEDKSSSEKKKEYLEKEGISSVGYWTYGYF